MDPNNSDAYDHYDIYFQSDYDQYMRDYQAYGHYVALCEQEAVGSSSGPKRRRTYIPRERETMEQRLMNDYFGDEEFEPKYSEENFRRMYRMSSTLFNKIVNKILSYDVEPIPEYFTYFTQRYDATGRLSIGPIMKCTSAIRQLAYDTAPDAFDKNCPKALHGQFKRRDHKYPHSYVRSCGGSEIVDLACILGVPGANNDLNVLYGSPLFDDELANTAPECAFVFKRVQEAARKDIERAFGNGTRNVVPTDAPANVVSFRESFSGVVLHFADVTALFKNGTRRAAPLLLAL
ncbi:hypothetical protein Tco_1328455 [Tanacetum coccineum]